MANNASAGATPVEADATSAQSTGPEPEVAAATAEPEVGDAGKRAIQAERKAAADALKRAEAAEKALKTLQDAALSETEKRDKRLAELETAQTDWQRERQEMVLATNVERGASKLGFIDPSEALALLDRAAVKYDDAGAPTNVGDLLADLAKAKPHLLAKRFSGSFDAAGSSATPGLPTFTRAQLRDHAFYMEHQSDIAAAMRDGRITG